MPPNVRGPQNAIKALNDGTQPQANANDSQNGSTPVKKPPLFDKKEYKYSNWILFALLIAFIVVIGILASVFINKLSLNGSDLGFNIMQWARNASLNPLDRYGFRDFLKLILTAFFFWLGVVITYFLNKQ